MKKLSLLLCVFTVCGIAPSEGFAQKKKEMTIEQAYLAIPHQRTQFDPKQSTLPDLEKAYLDHFFFVTDLALQKRMMLLHYFGKEQEQYYLKTYNTEIGNMLATFDLIQPPTEPLKKATDMLKIALRQQQKFFNDWADAKGTEKYRRLLEKHTSELMVISSHNTLTAIYALLQQTYPKEAPHNTKAFYDHLCSLDFI